MNFLWRLMGIHPTPFYCIFKNEGFDIEFCETQFCSKECQNFKKKNREVGKFFKKLMLIASKWLQIDRIWRLLIENAFKLQYSYFSSKKFYEKFRKVSTLPQGNVMVGSDTESWNGNTHFTSQETQLWNGQKIFRPPASNSCSYCQKLINESPELLEIYRLKISSGIKEDEAYELRKSPSHDVRFCNRNGKQT